MELPLKKSSKILAQLLIEASDPKTMASFLEELLTPSEILELAQRIKILKALIRGKSQREISQELGVSIATITRGSHLVKYGKGHLLKILAR